MFEKLRSALIGQPTSQAATPDKSATDPSFEQALAKQADSEAPPSYADATATPPAYRRALQPRQIPIQLCDADKTDVAAFYAIDDELGDTQADAQQARDLVGKLPRRQQREILEIIGPGHTRHLGFMLGEYTKMPAHDSFLLRSAIAGNTAIYERAANSALLDWLLNDPSGDPEQLERTIALRLRDMMAKAKARPALSDGDIAILPAKG